MGEYFQSPDDAMSTDPANQEEPLLDSAELTEAPGGESLHQQHQAGFDNSPGFENNTLLVPEEIPAVEPLVMVEFPYQQQQLAAPNFAGLGFSAFSLEPWQWNGLDTSALAPAPQILFGPATRPHEPPIGWPLQRASLPQIASPVPNLRRPPLFLVESGDVKRAVVQCGRRSVHVCVKFYLDYEYGLIDTSLAKELKLAFIPLPRDKRQARESPQGVIKPTKYVELTLMGMEPILGKTSFVETQLRLCVFRSNNTFVKMTLGRLAARTLGLERTDAQAV